MENSKNTSAGRIISELSRAAHIYLNHEFKKYAIGHAQIRTLLHVAHSEGQTQMDLAHHLNLDKSSITSQLQILEKNGYIKRKTSHKDARKQVIEITRKTEELLPSLKLIFMGWTETLLKGFNDAERVEIFNFLSKMKDNAQNKIKEIQKQ